MTTKLFDIKENGIFPTAACYTIGYLKDIIDEYGENAGKIFTYFHYMWSLNPDDNPFSNLPEDEKQEVIVRHICPEIDIDDPLIEEGLELIGKLYETPNYRAYKSFKKNIDKIARELEYVHISLNKEEGNAGEVKKGLELYDALVEKQKLSFKQMMDEMGVTEARGGRSRNKYSGSSEELE